MIIDSHVHISGKPTPVWNHPPFTAEQLLEYMDGPFTILGRERRVDAAVVQPHAAETLHDPDFRNQHAYISEVTARYPDRLVGCMTINPHLGVREGVDVLRSLVREKGYRAVKLHPTTHAYMPPRSLDLLGPVLEEAASLDIPVIIHTGDPPFALPVLMAPLAENFPRTTIVLAHLGSQKVTYADEAVYVARKNENIILETGWAPLPRLKEAVQAVGVERLVLGSDCPIQEIGSQIRAVEVLAWDPPIGMNLSEDQVEKILGDNFAGLIGLR